MIKGAQSIYRTLNILTLIVKKGEGTLSLKEISQQLEIPSPTVHRLLSVLKECRFVSYDPAEKGYRIGRECIISPNFDLEQQILSRFSPLAHEAAERFGYTVTLYTRHGDHCTCVERVEGTHTIQVFCSRPGEQRPLGQGSCTLGILAALPETEAMEILTRNQEELSKRLTGNLDILQHFFKVSQDLGYGYAHDLAVEGAVGVAFPLFSGKEVVGSIAVDALKGKEWEEKLDTIVEFFSKDNSLRLV